MIQRRLKRTTPVGCWRKPEAIFTPARIQQLIGQIREYRKQQFAAGNKTMAADLLRLKRTTLAAKLKSLEAVA